MPYGQGILPDGDNNENSSLGLKNTHTYLQFSVCGKVNDMWFNLSVFRE
jgi:hypothetical protein